MSSQWFGWPEVRMKIDGSTPVTLSDNEDYHVSSTTKSSLKDVDSVNNNEISNNTNNSNLLPPMNLSSQPPPPKSNHEIDSEFPVMSNSNASEDQSKSNLSSNGGQKKSEEQKSASDRYAALKDLDDMFKSTVLSEGKLYHTNNRSKNFCHFICFKVLPMSLIFNSIIFKVLLLQPAQQQAQRFLDPLLFLLILLFPRRWEMHRIEQSAPRLLLPNFQGLKRMKNNSNYHNLAIQVGQRCGLKNQTMG